MLEGVFSTDFEVLLLFKKRLSLSLVFCGKASLGQTVWSIKPALDVRCLYTPLGAVLIVESFSFNWLYFFNWSLGCGILKEDTVVHFNPCKIWSRPLLLHVVNFYIILRLNSQVVPVLVNERLALRYFLLVFWNINFPF